ncbi:hypothetical protein C8R45DRAFT_813683, partial [Mycena sanguinolenta]
FLSSNALTKSVRYASKFHRRQEITTFMKQTDDLETYTNLSMCIVYSLSAATHWLALGKFICDNYCQALKIIKTEPELKWWMVQEGLRTMILFYV